MTGTIAAIATPFGPGAIAVLRVSGEEACSVAARALGGVAIERWTARSVRLAKVRDEAGEVLDEVLVTIFRGPASYTGEDLVELSCHGGVLVTRRLLQRLLECGARAAEAGEFTQRAFLNGKMDLTQAEAVMDVISAQTGLALRAAQHQLGGVLGKTTEELRAELLGTLAHIEAYIDFPEEDIDPATGVQLTGRLSDAEDCLERLLATAEQGKILREGVRTVIYGAPNVGKSSLLNLLLGYDRAIVSDVAGTTRDSVEEVVDIGGIPVRLIDTAGVREARDAIERDGIERTRRHLEQADLVLEVVDGSQARVDVLARSEEDGRHHVLVINKDDLGRHPDWKEGDGVFLSCTMGTGREALTQALRDELAFGAGSWGQEAVAVNARHRDCLRRARESLRECRRQLEDGASPEFAAVDLRLALDAIGEIAGRVDTEELLGEIFGSFCIGK